MCVCVCVCIDRSTDRHRSGQSEIDRFTNIFSFVFSRLQPSRRNRDGRLALCAQFPRAQRGGRASRRDVHTDARQLIPHQFFF